jgi:hypothetical protein
MQICVWCVTLGCSGEDAQENQYGYGFHDMPLLSFTLLLFIFLDMDFVCNIKIFFFKFCHFHFQLPKLIDCFSWMFWSSLCQFFTALLHLSWNGVFGPSQIQNKIHLFHKVCRCVKGGNSYSNFKTIGYKFEAKLVENCLMGLAEETKAIISWPTWQETGIFKGRWCYEN